MHSRAFPGSRSTWDDAPHRSPRRRNHVRRDGLHHRREPSSSLAFAGLPARAEHHCDNPCRGVRLPTDGLLREPADRGGAVHGRKRVPRVRSHCARHRLAVAARRGVRRGCDLPRHHTSARPHLARGGHLAEHETQLRGGGSACSSRSSGCTVPERDRHRLHRGASTPGARPRAAATRRAGEAFREPSATPASCSRWAISC